MNNLKSKSEPTARQAAANVDAKKEVIANPNLAIAKNLVIKQSASAGLVGSYVQVYVPENFYNKANSLLNELMD